MTNRKTNNDQSDQYLFIQNDGPLIHSTNYWDTDVARAGLLYLSVNAGVARLLIPDSKLGEVNEMRKNSKYAILSQIPFTEWRPQQFCTELIFEDNSREPYMLHMCPNSVNRFVAEFHNGQQISCAVWVREKGTPCIAFELPMKVRLVHKVPYMLPWDFQPTLVIRPPFG